MVWICFVEEPVVRPAEGGTGWLLGMTMESISNALA